METLFSHFSDLASTALSLRVEACQRAWHLKADDQCPLMSQSMTKNQSTCTEFGQMAITDKVKRNIAAVFLVGNSTLRDLCQSQLPENRESKQGNAGAQGTQPCATWARPSRHPDASKLEILWQNLPCADSFYATYSQTISLRKLLAFSL